MLRCMSLLLAKARNLRQCNRLGRSLGYKRHAWRLGVMPALDPLQKVDVQEVGETDGAPNSGRVHAVVLRRHKRRFDGAPVDDGPELDLVAPTIEVEARIFHRNQTCFHASWKNKEQRSSA
jgi:hypothetical protein